jgi:hypothetical protein
MPILNELPGDEKLNALIYQYNLLPHDNLEKRTDALKTINDYVHKLPQNAKLTVWINKPESGLQSHLNYHHIDSAPFMSKTTSMRDTLKQMNIEEEPNTCFIHPSKS